MKGSRANRAEDGGQRWVPQEEYPEVIDWLQVEVPGKPGESRYLTGKTREVLRAYLKLQQRPKAVVNWYGFAVIQMPAKYVAAMAKCHVRTVFRALNVLQGLDLLHRRRATKFRGKRRVRKYSAKRRKHYGNKGATWITLPTGPQRAPSMIMFSENGRDILACGMPVQPSRTSEDRPTPERQLPAQLRLDDRSAIIAHAQAEFDKRLRECPRIFGKLDRDTWAGNWIQAHTGGLYSVGVEIPPLARGSPSRDGPGLPEHPTVH